MPRRRHERLLEQADEIHGLRRILDRWGHFQAAQVVNAEVGIGEVDGVQCLELEKAE